jgi:N-dimethylarginine dimethylaminohydrolase
MCPPDFYGIEYEINPWMDLRRPADPERARAQWRALYETLTETLGVRVELLTPVKGLPDLVFTANAGLVVPSRLKLPAASCREASKCEEGEARSTSARLPRDKLRGMRSQSTFVASRFLHPERQKEQPTYEAWFRARGYAIETLPEGTCFEGEGDALWLGDALFAGYRIRSDIRSHQGLAAMLGCEVLSLDLVDPRFYHLDTCFCPLDNRRALYYPPAFDDYGRRVIHEFVPEPIAVGDVDALRFACNAVVVGRDVVVQSGCDTVEKTLRAHGFTPRPVDLSEFHKAGGSAKCLGLWVPSCEDKEAG